MFQLQEKQRAKLTSVNLRAELHGDEPHSMIDMKFSFDTANDVLDAFDERLKTSFFRKAGKNDAKELLDGTEHALPYRVLNFPRLGPLKWEAKLPGYELAIHYGVESTLEFTAKELDGFVFLNKEGGTTNVSFRIAAEPGGKLDTLSELLGTEVEITLLPPTSETGQAKIGPEA